MDQYLPGLAELWQSPDGKQYGFPKDWDTVAVIVNEDMLAEAGLTKQQLDRATWNPTDGGSFQQIVAKLTVDNTGKRGDEPGFDPNNVKTYGLGVRPGRPDLRPDDLGGLRRQPRLRAARQEPVGHEVPLRRPALRADLHLVART